MHPLSRRYFLAIPFALLALICRLQAVDDAVHRYLYMASPDGAQMETASGKGILVFDIDVTQMPPAPKVHVELSMAGHGWVNFSLDGNFVWCHTPDIFDAHTKKQIATFRDETGKPVGSSKLIEVHMKNGKVVRMSSEFGLGRK